MLLSELEAHTFIERDDAVYTAAVPVRSDGTSAMTPGSLVPYLGALGRKVQSAGLALPAASAIAIDLESARIMPPESGLGIGSDAMPRLNDFMPVTSRPDRMSVDRPLDVDIVFAWIRSPMRISAISKGAALYNLASLVINLEKLGGAAPETLSRVMERARCYAIGTGSPDDLLGPIADALHSRLPTDVV
jgi:hypothetical protein